MLENALAQLLVAGPPSYLQLLGKIEVKRSHTHIIVKQFAESNFIPVELTDEIIIINILERFLKS